MTYRHVTNLRVPLEFVDMEMLMLLGDYRFGEPVPAKAPDDMSFKPQTLTELKAAGIVGLYTTEEALRVPAVRTRTGWLEPEKVLGKEWKA